MTFSLRFFLFLLLNYPGLLAIEDDIAYSKVCTWGQIERMRHLEPTKGNSSCPKQDVWMEAFSRASPHHHATIVAIGCNKAYEIVSYMRIWSGDDKYSVKKLYDDHIALSPDFTGNNQAGVCQTAFGHELDVSHMPKRFVKGYCIEPLKNTVEMVERSFKDLRYSHDIHVVKAAASSSEGTIEFPLTFPGVETLDVDAKLYHLPEEYNNQLDAVPMITVDGYFASNAHLKMHTIDWLSIDTEGHDPEVLKGAQHALETAKIKAFEFEYLDANVWRKTSLEEVIRHLHTLGYVCYWEMNDGNLLRLSNCFHKSYEKEIGWSNIVCAHRKSPLSPILYKIWEELFT